MTVRPVAEVAAENVAANRREFDMGLKRMAIALAFAATAALLLAALSAPEPAIHTPCTTTTGACP